MWVGFDEARRQRARVDSVLAARISVGPGSPTRAQFRHVAENHLPDDQSDYEPGERASEGTERVVVVPVESKQGSISSSDSDRALKTGCCTPV